jgi:hypothetical protein
MTLPKIIRGRAWKFGAKERRGGRPPRRRPPLGFGASMLGLGRGGRPAEPCDAETLR